MRIGYGYDVHRLVEGRKLILGGIEIPWERGLLGHSDADVLLHAIIDSLFGAVAAGDIGAHFPDTDPQYKGADSGELLRLCGNELQSMGYIIENIDATIVAQQPKMQPHIPAMRSRIAELLNISTDQVSIKAKTEEKLGFTGSGEGMSAHAVCLVEKQTNY